MKVGFFFTTVYSIFVLLAAGSNTDSRASSFCGPQILYRIYERYNVDSSITEIEKHAAFHHGMTSFFDLAEDASRKGLVSFGFEKGTIAFLEDALRQGCIIFNNRGHFSFIEKIEDGVVHIYDPGFSFEHYFMGPVIFESHWDSCGLIISNQPPGLLATITETALSHGVRLATEDMLRASQGANPCSNINGTGGPGFTWSQGNGATSNSWGDSYSGNHAAASSSDPVNLQNGNLFLRTEDMKIPALGMPINLTRYYNSQIISELDGWIPDAGSGSWTVENGEYSGEGDRSFLKTLCNDFTLDVDMRTVKPGLSYPWEVAWINFRFFDADNRYYMLIKTDGWLELARRKNLNSYDPPAILASVYVGISPTYSNRIHIDVAYNHIVIAVNGQTRIDLYDNDPLIGDSYVALESYYSHSHFDNFSIDGDCGAQSYVFSGDDNDFVFGRGWTHQYGLAIKEYSDHVTLIRENNSRQVFEPLGGGAYTPVPFTTYDELSKDASGFTLRTNHGRIFRFALDGRLAYIEDPNANRHTMSYSQVGGKQRLTAVTSNGGRAITLRYGPNNMVESVTDLLGYQVRYHYDDDRLVRVEDREQYETEYVYDPVNYNLIQLIDREDNSYYYTYSYNDRVLSQEDPLGNFTHIDYNWDTTHVVNDKGEMYKYNFDTAIFLQSVEDPNGHVDRNENDENGNVVDHFDKNNRNTHYTYDPNGNVIDIEDAKNRHTTYTYEPTYNLPLTRGDRRQNTTSYGYDTKGNLTKVTAPSPLNYETKMTYYGNGLLETMTDARGNSTSFAYNADGDLTQRTEPNERVTTFEYDANGRLTKTIDALTNETVYTYDKNGRLETITDPLDRMTSYTYTPNGHLENLTDPKNNTTTYEYDPFGNLLSVTDAEGGVQTNTYDTDNMLHLDDANLVTVTDQSWNPPTVMIYDKLDRLDTQTDALGDVYDYDYNLVGLLRERLDGNGEQTVYDYNELNKLTVIDYERGNDVQFTRDEEQNIEAIDDIRGRTVLVYDELNRLVTVQTPNVVDMHYSYDAVGNLTCIDYPSGKIVEYDYNENNEMIEVKEDGRVIVRYEYDHLGRRTTMIIYTSRVLVTKYVYDDVGQLKRMTVSRAASFLQGTEITMADGSLKPIEDISAGDEVLGFVEESQSMKPSTVITVARYSKASDRYLVINGRIRVTEHHRFYCNGSWVPARDLRIGDTIMTVQLVGVSVLSVEEIPLHDRVEVYDLGVADCQGYIADNTLASSFVPAVSGPYPEVTALKPLLRLRYTYDLAGNRTSVTTFTGTMNYSYDDTYQLTGVSGSQTYSYGYDAAGNRRNANGVSYTPNSINQYDFVGTQPYDYDKNGNLTSDGFFTYSYDLDNRLIIATAAGTTVAYTFDGEGKRIARAVDGVTTNFVISFDRIIEERDANWDVTAEYVYGPGLDEMLSMTRGVATYYYLADGLGSVLAVTDEGGAVVESYEYDPFGNVSIFDGDELPLSQSAIENPYLFTGRRLDHETSLYYYRARHYDPRIGRFLQRDPLGFWDGVHLYSFVGNNPVNHIDLLGLHEGSGGTNPIFDENLTDAELEYLYHDLYRRLQDRDGFNIFNPFDLCDEATFDTGFYVVNTQTVRYRGEVHTGGEVNYIAIGMYEAWKGSTLEEAQSITFWWKYLTKGFQTPSPSVYQWLERGYHKYSDMNQ